MKEMTSNKLSVTCDMCGAVFQRSPSQAEHAKYHKLLTAFFFLGIVPGKSEIKGVMPYEVHAT